MSYKTGITMNAVGHLKNITFGSKLQKQQSLFLVNHRVGLNNRLSAFARKDKNLILYLSFVRKENK